jgi:hypothetical protein
MWRMWTELNAKRYDSAQEAARRGAQAAGVGPEVYAALIRGVADPERRRAALTILDGMADSAPWNLNGAYRPSWLILLGDTVAALRAVEALKTHPTLFSVLNLWNPALDPIREQPRFRSTLEQLGLPFQGTEP